MDPLSARRITKNLVFIKENITQLSKVMDKLIENEHITMDEKADILTERNVDTQCHILLDTLIKRGGKAYQAFIEALKISANGHVADKILHTDLVQQDDSALEREETFFELDEHKEEIIQLIKERELYKMKLCELKGKYKTLKTENENKNTDIDLLNKEIDDLRSRLSSAEKKALEIDEKEKVRRNYDITPGSKKGILVQGDDVDGPKDPKVMEDGIDGDGLVSKVELQTLKIEELTKENEQYNSLVTTLENQVDELKSIVEDKEEKIMKLRNAVGKLQIYLEAGKQERDKIASELQKELERNRKENEERFDRMEEKMDLVIKMMNGNRNTRPIEINNLLGRVPTKPADINTPQRSPRNQKPPNRYNKKIGR